MEHGYRWGRIVVLDCCPDVDGNYECICCCGNKITRSALALQFFNDEELLCDECREWIERTLEEDNL